MKTSRIILAVLATASLAISAPAEARRSDPGFHPSTVTRFCGDRVCGVYGTRTASRHARARSRAASRSVTRTTSTYRADDEDSRAQRPSVGHRSGLTAEGAISAIGRRSSLCAAITGHLSCGCDTATYFGVRNSVYSNGRHDLDLASNWGRLPQSSGPCVNCAAWRSGHVMAIIGGGPGGWIVRDFNSGHGVTHEYTTASLRGYRFAIPADLRIGGTQTYHARRHYQHIRYARR